MDLNEAVIRDFGSQNLIPVRDFDEEYLRNLPVVEDVLLRLPLWCFVDVATEERSREIPTIEADTSSVGDLVHKVIFELIDGADSWNVVPGWNFIALIDDHDIRAISVVV